MGGKYRPMEGVGRPMKDTAFFRGKRIFVTGHTGFKGAWLCRILTGAGAAVTGYSLSAPTRPNLFSMAGLEGEMASVIGDIRDRETLFRAFEAAQPEIVLHLAAQPIVRDSYKDPVCTYETNVLGTVNLLECVRTLQAPVRSVVIITTDKVYSNREWVWGYREDEPLDGYDPYSNSKSCAELAVHCYQRSFLADSGIAVSKARAGNVIGGGDFANDRIIPDCVRAAQSGKPVIVRNPHSTRPYQHVLEPLSAYLMIARMQYQEKRYAGWYNVGPDECDCVTTGELAGLFCRTWDSGLSWEDRADPNAPHEANFLKLDCSKIRSVLGWKPRWHITDAVEKTVEWTRVWMEHGDIPAEMDRQIAQYMEGQTGTAFPIRISPRW